MLDVELEGRAAGHGAVDVAVVDAEVLGHRHRFDGAARHAGAQVAVDRALLEPGVRERALDRLHVVTDRIEVRRARRVRETDADDHGVASLHAASDDVRARSRLTPRARYGSGSAGA